MWRRIPQVLRQPVGGCNPILRGVPEPMRSGSGFARKFRETGEQVAFFDTGATVLALYPWDKLAADAALPVQPQPAGFRGITLAWNCRSEGEVDEVLNFAVGRGATLQKAAHHTSYGGYSGYFTDPDGHPWEVVVAPGIEVGDDRRVHLQE
ncbi:MAG: VOC family protein [Rhodospirillales bacterium]|nr:VOC family protein [Rhodospirillales bacterium]